MMLTMKVKDLINLLTTFDQDLEVITTRYSDFQDLDAEDISVVDAVRKAEWIMRVPLHPESMDETENKSIKKYLHFAGN